MVIKTLNAIIFTNGLAMQLSLIAVFFFKLDFVSKDNSWLLIAH